MGPGAARRRRRHAAHLHRAEAGAGDGHRDIAGVDLAFRPTFAYGTGGFAMGGLITGSVDLGQGVQLGFGYGGQWAHGGPASQGAGFDQQVSYGGSSRGFSYYRTHFVNNETPQIVGTVGYESEDFGFQFSNHVSYFLGDGDRFRTAAVQVRYQDVVAGFNLFTGTPGDEESRPLDENGNYNNGLDHGFVSGGANDPSFRFSPAYVGLRRNGRIYQLGVEGEPIRDVIQNAFMHALLRRIYNRRYPGDFKRLDNDVSAYSGVFAPSPFHLY